MSPCIVECPQCGLENHPHQTCEQANMTDAEICVAMAEDALTVARRRATFEAHMPHSEPAICTACEEGDHGSIGAELSARVFRCTCACHGVTL